MTTKRHTDTDGETSAELPVRTDWTEAETPVAGVTEALVAATGRRVADLDPLEGSVDTDALNALVRSDEGDTGVYVSFTHEGFSVSVAGAGAVTVEPAPGELGDEPTGR